MALSDLTSPSAVEAALDEFDELGRGQFLQRYGFGPARRYFVKRNGRLYDSKAIAAAAHGHQLGRALTADEFVGGLETVVPKLRDLGFEIVKGRPAERPYLRPDREYSWEQLGELFDFAPDYLNRAGGMVSRPAMNCLLLITHPGGGQSFDYDDYWDGPDLIYTGRGQRGDQVRTGQNRDVGENARDLLIFESAGRRRLRFLGEATCVDEWDALGEDITGAQRGILRFRLRFDEAPAGPRGRKSRSERGQRRARREPERVPRKFDPSRAPNSYSPGGQRRPREETLALQEKATREHHELLVFLAERLSDAGWTEIDEIYAAVDLWARRPDGRRVIFEAKTVTDQSEPARLRGALGQLLEYRFFYGNSDDELCVVVNRTVTDRRARFLGSLGVAVARVDGERLLPTSHLARSMLGGMLDAPD